MFSQERNTPGHGVSHTLNAEQVAMWYMKQIGVKGRKVETAQIATLLHDVEKEKPQHARAGERYVRRMLRGALPRDELHEVSVAVTNHSWPLVRDSKKMPTSHVTDAVFFADRLEGIGHYGVFRCIAGSLDDTGKLMRLKKREAELRIQGLSKANARRTALREGTIEDIGIEIAINKKLGKPRSRKNRVPVEEYYPKEVLPILRGYRKHSEAFLRALRRGRPWAEEIMGGFTQHAGTTGTDLNTLIRGFEPKTKRAIEFKENALQYIDGDIEGAL